MRPLMPAVVRNIKLKTNGVNAIVSRSLQAKGGKIKCQIIEPFHLKIKGEELCVY